MVVKNNGLLNFRKMNLYIKIVVIKSIKKHTSKHNIEIKRGIVK